MSRTTRSRRFLLWLLLLVVSLVGCAVPAATREAIPAIISAITPESCEQQLRSLVALGPRYAGDSDETQRAVEYLEKRLMQLGYQVQREAVGLWRGVEQVNLIVEIEGLLDPATVVEVGAHYDTVRNCPGADDNGSGVAGVLEIARVLVDHRPERTVRMCFFAAEEVGLVGSRAHVERILADSSRRVDGLLDLEMIGYRVHEQGSQDAPVRIPLIASIPQQGDFILVAGNFQSGGLGNIFEGCVDRYVPGLKYFSANRIAGFFGDAARSDHYPYWQAGLRGIMLTDTANFRNPHYHRRTDTIDTIDFEFLCAVSRATAAALIEWGGRVPGAPEVVRTGRIEGDSGGKFALDRANGAKTPNRVRLPARSGVDPEWSFWDRDLRDSAVFPDVGTTPGLRSTDSTGGSDAFLFLDARACHGSPAAGPGGRAGSAAETRSDSQADPR